ncbi:hypothetical protein [Rhodopirellula europaea]|uniref:Uncharacterized protein n=1 Tax=Rhodopirellula europaea SH398 TaxID=1263868 RepID=M5RYI0_9BACT|nr:hypothetical protein [Rhodopirellula europaea]EMI24413.1 hypothetical protein RESH_05013 [Rhodopirellula europaea SH398]
MDPQVTWNALIREWSDGNWLDVFELAEALFDWLSNDGFPPETMGTLRLGADWNQMIGLAAAKFALKRANEVLDNPAGIPDSVPFTLTCANCNNEGPSTVCDALEEGWSHFQYVPAGMSEKFLGYCPVCRKRDLES